MKNNFSQRHINQQLINQQLIKKQLRRISLVAVFFSLWGVLISCVGVNTLKITKGNSIDSNSNNISNKNAIEEVNKNSIEDTNENSTEDFKDKLKENAPEQRAKPYVLMILIDGYRHDYNSLYHPKILSQFEKEGSGAKALIPIYPSKTFPNHYAMMTGLYAENHELVSNQFIDPSDFKVFKMGDSIAAKEERWFQGKPLWYLAEKQGMLTACYFWVGCEASIKGIHSQYSESYDDHIPYNVRVEKVLNWLRLPEARRPHLLTLYFPGVDSAGHRFGTHSEELKKAINEVDEAIGQLQAGLKTLPFSVNTIIVSDHGMQDLDPTKVVVVDDNIDLSSFEIIGWGPQVQLYLKPNQDSALISNTVSKLNSKNIHVYTRSSIPSSYHYRKTNKVGDIIIEAKAPYSLIFKKDKGNLNKLSGANHGYHPSNKNMWGIFFAQGPGFKKGIKIKPIENINLYPLVLNLLHLTPEGKMDGQLQHVHQILK